MKIISRTGLINFFVFMVFMVLFTAAPVRAQSAYPWLSGAADEKNGIQNRIDPPPFFRRVPCPAGSFGEWLRGLPLKDGNPPVFLHDGRKKWNQGAHAAVVRIDVGKKDLQQCADAVMRLRAEYFYSLKAFDRIAFDFTSGTEAAFSKWAKGFRPKIKGSRVTWERTGRKGFDRENFRKYLEIVFTYAGTASLQKEMKKIGISEMRPGDVFIRGGFPGHAVLVADMAENKDGKRVFLLLQSFMPAQDVHVLKNPRRPEGLPWYDTDFSVLKTPEWRFEREDLHRF